MSHENPLQKRFESQEILSIFARFAEGVELKSGRFLEDVNGIYLLEATIPDPDGGTIEFNFMRKGRYPEGDSSRTSIHKVFYDADGIPCGGVDVASYNEETGQWEDSV